MEYHADRFEDSSLCIFEDNTLLAVFPGNRSGTDVISHGGLTFGGIIFDDRMKGSKMIEVMNGILRFLLERGIKRVLYKAIPYIFHTYPSQEDLFALTLLGAQLHRREISSAILLKSRLEYSKGKREGLRKAAKAGIVVRESRDYSTFHAILSQVLEERHGVRPVHSVAEMELLGATFPNQIKLYGAFNAENMVAGAWIFINPKVIHTQYLASSAEGKQIGGIDSIIDYLIRTAEDQFDYLSFGISSYDGGKKLNPGLLSQKEMLGGRCIVHDTYEIMTSAILPEGILHVSA